jgi:hypothetical protein
MRQYILVPDDHQGSHIGIKIDHIKTSSRTRLIGARTSKVDAFIGEGILEYDSAGLPAGSCVTASINAGIVNNNRDFNCANVGAVLHGHSSIITVK